MIGKVFGVWFPDLPGCVSAGDTLDEAMLNAAEALALWAEAMIESGLNIPPARSLTELKADSAIAEGLARYMVALIAFPQRLGAALKTSPSSFETALRASSG